MEAKKTEKPDIYTLLNELFAVQMSESQLFEEALETLEETRREIVKQLMGDFREKQARLEQEFASLGALNGQKLAEAYFDAFLTAFNGTVQRGCDAVMSNRLEKS